MKIISFQDGLKEIKKQLNELNRKIESHDGETSPESFNKRDFLNTIIMESLNESEREKEQILNSLVERVCYMDLDYNIKWLNSAGLKSVAPETSMTEIIGQPCYKIWHNRETPCEQCPVTTTLRTGWPWKEEMTTSEGRTVLVSSQPVVDDNGTIIGLIEIELDITMRKDVERALEKSQQRSRAILDVIPDFLLIFNTSGRLIDYHPAADFNIFSATASPEGKLLPDIMPAELASVLINHSRTMESTGVSRNFEYADKNDPSEFYYNCRLIKTTETEYVCIIRDVTSQKYHEKEILHKSFHDKLTGLYNRAYFDEELKRIDHSRAALPTSILIIDINSLKLTNDAFGHDYGDRLIKAVSDILTSNCRKSDVIARTGGDEFSIILPGSPLEKAQKLSERITAACRTRQFDDIFARPSVSVGCAERVDTSVALEDIIKLADERMYKMKLANRTAQLNTLMNDIISTMNSRGWEQSRHTESCMRLSERFAMHLNHSSETIEKLRRLSLVHDIGNIRLSENILMKPGKLTEEELTEVRQHPIIGFRIAKAIPDYASIANLVLSHHERWDGTGYPTGLSGREIPVECRIFSLIDSYDALVSGTGYKEAVSKEDAASEILLNRGKQFDPDLTDRFINFIEDI